MDDVNFCICKLCGISIGQLSIDLDDRNPLPLGLSRGFRFSVEFSTLFFFRTRHKKGFEPEFFSIKTNVPEIFFLQEIDTTLFLFSTPYDKTWVSYFTTQINFLVHLFFNARLTV